MYITLKSVKIFIDEVELYSVPASELAGLSEYRLETTVAYNLDVGQSYPMRIEIRDERDKIHNEWLTVMRITPKKVTGIRVVNTTGTNPTSVGRFELTYDDQDRLVEIYCSNGGTAMTDQYRMWFYYNDNNMVEHMDYFLINYGAYFRIEFTYDTDNRVDWMLYRMLYYVDGVVGDTRSTFETLQNFHYRPDGTMERFDMNITTINDIQYADGFYEGEKIFAERWYNQLIYYSTTNRIKKSGFVPIPNPTYHEGMPPLVGGYALAAPPFWNAHMDLFYYKYLYTETEFGPDNTSSPTAYRIQFTYTIRADGLVESFTKKAYASTSWWTHYYEYEGEE